MTLPGGMTLRGGLTRGARFAAGALVGLLALAGCADGSSIAEQARAGDRKGYAAGDGSIEKLEPGRRGAPVALSGVTVDGRTWSLADVGSKVVVVNVWGSWCGPCVEEAPHLQKVWSELSAAGRPVQFVGIDFKEGPEAGAAFLRAKAITYPSLSNDAEGGRPMLALGGKAPTVPSTLVLDTRGRIAARVLGPVSEGTLRALVEDVLGEQT